MENRCIIKKLSKAQYMRKGNRSPSKLEQSNNVEANIMIFQILKLGLIYFTNCVELNMNDPGHSKT